MLPILSFVLFTIVMIISIAAIIATVKAELPYILRTLGIDPTPLQPLHSTRVPRVRVTRPLWAVERPVLRAAA